MKRKYQGPEQTSIEEADRIFATGSDSEICQTLVDLAFSPDVDPAYTQECCFRFLRQDNWLFWGISAVCLGHLLPRFEVDLDVALPLLEARVPHPNIGGQVGDGLSDLRHCHPGLRPQTTAKHRAMIAQRILNWISHRTSSATLWMEMSQYGGEEEFSRLYDLLEPFVEPESEPDGAEREVIEREARRVREAIQVRPFVDAPLHADERVDLVRGLREAEDRLDDLDTALDLEQKLAAAALSMPEAAAALREINEDGACSRETRENLLAALGHR